MNWIDIFNATMYVLILFGFCLITVVGVTHIFYNSPYHPIGYLKERWSYRKKYKKGDILRLKWKDDDTIVIRILGYVSKHYRYYNITNNKNALVNRSYINEYGEKLDKEEAMVEIL